MIRPTVDSPRYHEQYTFNLVSEDADFWVFVHWVRENEYYTGVRKIFWQGV